MFDQTVESKTNGWKDIKFIQNNDLYQASLKNRTLTELILTPQSFNSDIFSQNTCIQMAPPGPFRVEIWPVMVFF